MAYQPILAGSKNVDIVYGPDDRVPLTVMNLGKARTVDVVVSVRNTDGEEVMQKTYQGVELPDGRSYTDLASFKPEIEKEGYYAFHYTVLEKNH